MFTTPKHIDERRTPITQSIEFISKLNSRFINISPTKCKKKSDSDSFDDEKECERKPSHTNKKKSDKQISSEDEKSCQGENKIEDKKKRDEENFSDDEKECRRENLSEDKKKHDIETWSDDENECKKESLVDNRKDKKEIFSEEKNYEKETTVNFKNKRDKRSSNDEKICKPESGGVDEELASSAENIAKAQNLSVQEGKLPSDLSSKGYPKPRVSSLSGPPSGFQPPSDSLSVSKMGFGDYPVEYNPKVHGPYDPSRFYGKPDTPFGQVKLNELGSWFARRNKSPQSFAALFSRSYWRWQHKYMLPKRSGMAPFFQFVTAAMLFSYIINYDKLKYHYHWKYH